MSFVLLTLLFGTALSFYIWLKHHYSYWSKRQIPHETPLYFIGNMKGMGTLYHWRDINQRIYKRFKGTSPVVGCYAFFERSAFIMDLNLVKQILVKDFNNFPDRGLFYNEHDDPLTANLVFVDGEDWRIMRRIVTPVFSTAKMKYMFPNLVNVGKRLIEAFDKILESKSTEIEIKDLCARYTTDVIGTCAFGIECNSLIDPNAEFRQMGRSAIQEPRHNMFVQAFMFNQPELARKLRMKNFKDNVSEFFMNAVRETVEYRQKFNVKRNDLMDILVDLKAKYDEKDLKNGLTMEQVAAQAMVFFLAGFETSSTLMTFCIYELAIHQEVQNKLRIEILEVMEKNNGQINYESIKEMTYLEKVICETLRLHSTFPHTTRRVLNDYKIPNTNITLEKGLRIFIPIDCYHMDPEYFPTPEKFYPERFSSEEIAKRHPFAYLPFGDGPRNCIGMRFGKMQAEVGLISLLSNFKFNVTKDLQIPLKIDPNIFFISPEGGVALKVERIQKN